MDVFATLDILVRIVRRHDCQDRSVFSVRMRARVPTVLSVTASMEVVFVLPVLLESAVI